MGIIVRCLGISSIPRNSPKAALLRRPEHLFAAWPCPGGLWLTRERLAGRHQESIAPVRRAGGTELARFWKQRVLFTASNPLPCARLRVAAPAQLLAT